MAELQFALSVALGIAYILEQLLDFLHGDGDGATPLSPVLRDAVVVVLATLPFVYFTGIVLLQLQVAPAAPPAPAAATRSACIFCVMMSAFLLVLTVLLLAVLLLAGDSPPGCGRCGWSGTGRTTQTHPT